MMKTLYVYNRNRFFACLLATYVRNGMIEWYQMI